MSIAIVAKFRTPDARFGLYRELVEPEGEDEEEEDDEDEDDGFIPRGLPTRPTGAGAPGGPRPVKAR